MELFLAYFAINTLCLLLIEAHLFYLLILIFEVQFFRAGFQINFKSTFALETN